MEVGKAIYNILVNDSDVNALVNGRILPNVARTTTAFPFIIYQVTGQNPEQDKDGPSTLDTDSVMVSIYSGTYAEATNLSNKVRIALERTSGTFNGVEVQSIKYDGYNDLFNDNSDGEGVFRKALDFDIRVVRPPATTPFTNVYSLDFDGVDDYVTFGDADVFTPNNSGANRGFSISCWVKLANTGGQTIINKSHFFDAGNKFEFQLRTFFNTCPIMIFYGGNSETVYQRLIIDTVLSVDTWYHIAFTFNLADSSSSIVGYLNGVQATDGSGGTYSNNGTWSAITNTTAALQFARLGTNSTYTECKLDEVALFDDVLTSSTVTSIYNSGTPTDLSSESYLLGYWRNGDTAGTSVYPTIEDFSTNSNDGTMTNMVSGDINTDVP